MTLTKTLAFWSMVGVGSAFPFLPSLPLTSLDATNTSFLDARATTDEFSGLYDLSSITSWAALGDSYAAGIGAGKPLGSIIHQDDWLCSRWDNAYPYLLNQMEEFGTGARDFQFLACSGWTSNQIREKQVPKLKDKSQQLITLSSGGNDVYLSDLLDYCVYQITPGAALRDNCKEVMDKTSDTIDKDLGGWLDQLYSALKMKLTDDGKIYVTGYAQFWNSKTSQCDEVSWKTWNIPQAAVVKLSKANRKRMNELAVKVNNKIKEVIRNSYSDKIVFIDIDPYVVALQGRFCEPKVSEPDSSRLGLLFYNRDTSDQAEYGEDNWPHTELKRAPEEVPKDSFEGSIAVKFEDALKQHPDWKLSTGFSKPTIAEVEDTVKDGPKTTNLQDTISSLLPDTFKRIFHPRPFLHQIMAQLVLFHVVNDKVASAGMGMTPMPERFSPVTPENTSCKAKSPPHGRPRDLVCRETDWRAPKEKTSDGSTSVNDAIKQFCKNRNGETAEKGTDHEHIYDRWDISGWGVTKRQSLWLRASSGPFSQCPKGTLKEGDCIAVLTGGLDHCDQGSDFTFGYRAQGENCMEYAVETSPSVHEGDPPWAEHVHKYPPPETLMADLYIASQKHQVDCYTGRGFTWNWDDANAAINQYCNNNLKNGGHSPSFSVQKGTITVSASVNFPFTDDSPYKDKAWCSDFDFGHKNSDDCKYAFRKILGTRMDNHYECLTHYRCVQYSVRTWTSDNLAFPARDLGGIEDNANFPNSQQGPVRTAGWNATSGWNSTGNATLETWDPKTLRLPDSQWSNSSVFVTDM